MPRSWHGHNCCDQTLLMRGWLAWLEGWGGAPELLPQVPRLRDQCWHCSLYIHKIFACENRSACALVALISFCGFIIHAKLCMCMHAAVVIGDSLIMAECAEEPLKFHPPKIQRPFLWFPSRFWLITPFTTVANLWHIVKTSFAWRLHKISLWSLTRAEIFLLRCLPSCSVDPHYAS